MSGPTDRQIAYATDLGIDVSQCRTTRDASRAISQALYKREMEIAKESGIRGGAAVYGRYDGDPAGHVGRVRYVKIFPREIFDGGPPLVIGVDWIKPKEHFSRVRAKGLTVIDEQK